jgi:hypothetical protein
VTPIPSFSQIEERSILFRVLREGKENGVFWYR